VAAGSSSCRAFNLPEGALSPMAPLSAAQVRSSVLPFSCIDPPDFTPESQRLRVRTIIQEKTIVLT
jgi:hypothetical protein